MGLLRRTGFGFRVVLAALAAAETVGAQDPGDLLRIHFLDVGQADAALIEAPGTRWVLVDAGRDGRVVDELRRLGVDTIDLFIASHNHADHIGGAAEVVRTVPVRNFMDNGVAHTTVTYRTLLEALLEADVPLLEPERRTITLGEVSLEILPPPGDPALGHNDNSVGVLVRFGAFRAMMAGDAEGALWEHWLETAPDLIVPVEVHKASHHGSRNGDISSALALLRPSLVVVSAGSGNPYGHPHAEALERYHEVGATVLLTAEEGRVTVTATTSGVFDVRTERQAGRPPSRPASAFTPAEADP